MSLDLALRLAPATTKSLYSYDNDGRITKFCQATGTDCTSASGYSAYDYDLNGNRTKHTVHQPGGATTQTHTTYDTDDRPIQDGPTAGGAPTSTYTYDDNGNLHTQQDASGTRTFTYGLDANLHQVTLQDGRNLTYAYDEKGNRTSRAINGAQDVGWQYDTLGDLSFRIAETNAAGAPTHQWWADPVTSLGTALTDAPANALPLWMLEDFQGSITDTADGSTTLTGTTLLDPYGSQITTSGTAHPLRFHGQYQDFLTGLYDLRARDYNPGSGTFTAPDPVKPGAGTPYTSTYHYGYNNPAAFTDPTGEWGFLIKPALGAIVGGGVSYLAHGASTGDWWSRNAAWAAGSGALAGAIGSGFAGAGSRLARYGGYALGGGAGNAAYGYGTSGGNYGWGDAGRDFAIGAGFGLGFAGAGSAFARYIKPRIPPQIAAWSKASLKKAWGPLRKSLVKCPGLGRFGNSRWDDAWSMSPRERGLEIEDRLGGNLPVNFPVIDKWKGGVATSIKSINLNDKSYRTPSGLRSKVKEYVNAVANFDGRRWGERSSRRTISRKECLRLSSRGVT